MRKYGNENETSCSGCLVLRSEEGVVLVLVLILSVIALAFIMGLMTMVTGSTQMTGGDRRFESALESGRGGREVARQMIDARGIPDVAASLNNFAIPAFNVGGVDCLTQKLTFDTGVWNALCNDEVIIDAAIQASYDMTFTLGVAPVYTIYAKIVDTVLGNTGVNEPLETDADEIVPTPIYYHYTIEVVSEDTAGGSPERARLSMLYQY